MSSEQEKIDLFYDKLKGGRLSKPQAWIGLGFLVFVVVLLCVIPAQHILTEDGNMLLIPMWIFILTGLSMFFRVYPYEFYSENTKNRSVQDELLKYHPVNIKTMKKMMIQKEFFFLTKFAIGCLLAQLVSTYMVYHMIEWMNVVYILIFVFIMPMLLTEIGPRVIRYKIYYSKQRKE